MTEPIISALLTLNQSNLALIEALRALKHEPDIEALLEKLEKGESRIIGALKKHDDQQ